mmetsp:Transcript_1196/g.3343  ORF Transcript_1196/g.3343 Transcript_1196/m.3343 type:complete len:203 (+) Transcript_1196:620-1228(+)
MPPKSLEKVASGRGTQRSAARFHVVAVEGAAIRGTQICGLSRERLQRSCSSVPSSLMPRVMVNGRSSLYSRRTVVLLQKTEPLISRTLVVHLVVAVFLPAQARQRPRPANARNPIDLRHHCGSRWMKGRFLTSGQPRRRSGEHHRQPRARWGWRLLPLRHHPGKGHCCPLVRWLCSNSGLRNTQTIPIQRNTRRRRWVNSSA